MQLVLLVASQGALADHVLRQNISVNLYEKLAGG
jgi:hypothetical protein